MNRRVMAPEKAIPFNCPTPVGRELECIKDALDRMHTAGDGHYLEKCQQFLAPTLQVRHVLLTTSCTHALEMAAMLLNVQPGDEVVERSHHAGQAHLNFRPSKDLKKIVVVPTGSEAFSFDTGFESFVLFEEIQGDVANGGEVFSGEALSNSAVIFTETDIEAPMQLILNTP